MTKILTNCLPKLDNMKFYAEPNMQVFCKYVFMLT